MKNRRIYMTKAAHNLPAVTQAAIDDKATIPAPYLENQIEYCDNLGHDYPSLRLALTQAGAAYDYYGRKEDEADHETWSHGRNGNAEIFSRDGYSAEAFAPLDECEL
ncbi:MAG: hypothetical protein WC810_01070 [Janthinobacterium sp.]